MGCFGRYELLLLRFLLFSSSKNDFSYCKNEDLLAIILGFIELAILLELVTHQDLMISKGPINARIHKRRCFRLHVSPSDTRVNHM